MRLVQSFFYVSLGLTLFLVGCSTALKKNSKIAGQTENEKNAQTRMEQILEINEDLVMGLKDNQWYFVPVDTENGEYLTQKARLAFVTDNGPDYFSEGLARFVEGAMNALHFGFIDEKGVVMIPAQFDFAGPFELGYSVVCSGCGKKMHGEIATFTGGKWGIIDKKGTVVVPVEFDEILFDAYNKKVTGMKSGRAIPIALDF